MTFRLEYDYAVRRLIPASVAGFVLCAGMGFVPQSCAQSNGAASAGTSAGSSSGSSSGTAGHGGGSAAAGPSSGAAHGQSGQTGSSGHTPGSGTTHSGSGGNHSGSGENHGQPPHHHGGESVPYIGYVIAVPYAVDQAADDDSDADDDADADYQGGPTVFDRRGSGADSYVPPVSDVPMPHAREQTEVAGDEGPAEKPQPVTVLVFKDGHNIEVGNYAIVGETLFDLTPGHARRVALADLDLEATRKQNDDRGVVFELPASPQAN